MSKSSPSRPSIHWREVGGILGGWVLITIIAGVVTAVSNPCTVPIPWTRLVANQSAQFGVWALLTPAIFWLARVPLRPLPRFSVLQAGGLVGAIGGVSLLRPIIHNLAIHPPDDRHAYVAWMGVSFLRNAHFDVLVYGGLFVVGLALTHYRRAQERGRRAASLEAELSKAQLQVLQTQVDPHFLFNALNTISGLAEEDPALTRRILARLSSLLRRSLDATKGAEIALAEEVSFVRQYLEIMQIRYGDRLETDVRVSADAERALVPAFCLQLLVENAIKHGVSQVVRPGRIRIRGERDGDELVVVVEDNGPGWEAPVEAADCGVGLSNLRSRLRQLYGAGASLTLTNRTSPDTTTEALGARVTLRLPYRMEGDGEAGTPSGLGREGGGETDPSLLHIFPNPVRRAAPHPDRSRAS